MENLVLKKLNIKPGFTVLVDRAPENILEKLGTIPASIQLIFNEDKDFDALILFVKTADDLINRLKSLSKSLKPETVIWMAYPKKKSGITTDLSMMGSWDFLKCLNLIPCASASISDWWTGIRLKPSDQVKSSGHSKASIKNNQFSEFINVDQKQVTLPDDLEKELNKYPIETAFFEKLSWSNKKEYVLWILTAKQEKTRTMRILKMIEMLAHKKKNPTMK